MNRYNIAVTLLGVLVAFSAFLYIKDQSSNEVNIGTELPQAVALFETSLASPMTADATSMTLTSNSVRGGGSVSGYNCFTIDEGSAQAEFVCGTASGTAVTGLTRGISPADGITEDADLKFSHRRGASVKITDFPIIQLLRAQSNGEGTFENVIRYASDVIPSGADDLADVGYVLSVVNGGAVTFDRLVVAGRAGETVATGTLVYFNRTDQEWYKVSSTNTATYQNKSIGLTQGNGTNGNSIGGGGILLKGRSTVNTGLTAGSVYYASTSGAIATTSSSFPIGETDSTSVLYFDPVLYDVPRLSWSNAFTGTTTFSGLVTGAFTSSSTTFNASGTFSKNSATRLIRVELWGAGGSGANTTSGSTDESGGGGGGAYCEYWFPASSVTSTIAITIGTGGAARSSTANGAAGGDTTFSSYLTAFGGGGGGQSSSNGGGGGGGGCAQAGGSSTSGTSGAAGDSLATAGSTATEAFSAYGGAGGGMGVSGSSRGGGNSYMGGGGGGGAANGNAATGGTSKFGGAGGAADANALGNATSGSQPGGGGGAKNSNGGTGSSGAGGNGRAVITEFY